MTAADHALARRIDHTLLRPDATGADVDRLCAEACAFGFAAACVQPVFAARATRRLAGSGVGLCVVVSFPHGASSSAVKAVEARRAVEDGADEVDMVLALGALRAGEHAAVRDDIAAVVAAAARARVKVILETALLTDAEKEIGARLAVQAGAHFVKTCTGFGGGGATEADVALLRRVVGPAFGVKASGGIRTRAQAVALLAAGADRLGCSMSVAVVTGEG